MKLIIEGHNLVLPSGIKKYIERRIDFAFAHHGFKVEQARITLFNVDDVDGAQSKQCRVEVQMKDGVAILVSDTQSDMHASIDRALFRATYNVQKRIKRQYALEHEAHYRRIIAKAGNKKALSS